MQRNIDAIFDWGIDDESCFLQLRSKINVTSNKVADREDGVIAHRPWWSDFDDSCVIDFD